METNLPNPTETIHAIYDAFGRGDIPFILGQLDANVVWEFEAAAVISFGGIRRGPAEVAGFFEGIAKDHVDPKLAISDVFADGDKVAALAQIKDVDRSSKKTAAVLLDSAVVHELCGERDIALSMLSAALKAGTTLKEIENERELIALRADARYQFLLAGRPAK